MHHQIDNYIKSCMSEAEQVAAFIDKYFYSTDKFKGTYKRSETSDETDIKGIDVYETVNGITRSVDEKAYTSNKGQINKTFSLELSQNTTDYNLNIQFHALGWLLQNKNYNPNNYKKINDYYELIWINELKNGKSDRERKDILKKIRNKQPHKPLYNITMEDYQTLEAALFSVAELLKALEKVGIPLDRLEEASKICLERYRKIYAEDKKTRNVQFSFEEILGIKLKDGYEGKINGQHIYFTVSRIKTEEGFSLPVNIIVPKEFYLAIPGCEHRIISANSSNTTTP